MSTPFQTPERQASLSEVFFPGILCRLHQMSFEGTVQARNGPLTKSVYFRDGVILSAASNDDADRLSSILLRKNLLTREQLDMARDKARPGASLGRSLVELGFVSRNQLMETARDQVRGILESLFEWTNGNYQILENQIPASVPNLGMRTEQLLFSALSRSSNRESILREVGGMDMKFGPAEIPQAEWKQWGLGEEANRVLGAVNGVRTVNHIAAEVDTDDFSIVKMLCAGLHLGLLERVEPPNAGTRRAPAVRTEPPAPVAAQTGPAEVPPDLGTAGEDSAAPSIPEQDAPEAPVPPPAAPEIPAGAESGGPPPGFEPTGLGDSADTEVQIELEAETQEEPVASNRAEGFGTSEISDSGPAPATSPEPEPPPPIATQSVPVPTEPEPPAAAASGPSDPGPFRMKGNGNGNREGVELQTPPEEGPFHGFVDTSLESGGRTGGRPGSRSRSRWFAVGGFLIGGALIVTALAVWSSRGSTEPDRDTPLPAETAAAPIPEETHSEAGPGTPEAIEASPVESAGPEKTTVDSTTVPTAVPPPATPEPDTSKPPAAMPAAQEPPQTRSVPTGPAEPVPSSTTPIEEAREALNSGRFSDAARAFRSAVSETPQEYTLQLLLACKTSTIAGLMPPPEGLILLPQHYKGQDCFRVCWGRFPSRSAALTGSRRIPGSLAGLTANPFPLAFSSVTAAGKTP